jgi:hypothetical protein
MHRRALLLYWTVLAVLPVSVIAGDDIASALERLRTRTNNDRYVILEAAPTDRYVQFTSENGAVVYDFPVEVALPSGLQGRFREGRVSREAPPTVQGVTPKRYLSEAEQSRLDQLLKKRRLEGAVVYTSLMDEQRRVIGWSASIHAKYQADLSTAEAFATAVFREVFQIREPYTIRILEH